MHLAGEFREMESPKRFLCVPACRGSIVKHNRKCQQAEPTRLGSTQISGKIPTECTKSSCLKRFDEHSTLEVLEGFQGIHLDLCSVDLTMLHAAFQITADTWLFNHYLKSITALRFFAYFSGSKIFFAQHELAAESVHTNLGRTKQLRNAKEPTRKDLALKKIIMCICCNTSAAQALFLF